MWKNKYVKTVSEFNNIRSLIQTFVGRKITILPKTNLVLSSVNIDEIYESDIETVYVKTQ